ncbi:OmpL47-type beta-barrel domain-containing protein [Rhodococcus aerolatus]
MLAGIALVPAAAAAAPLPDGCVQSGATVTCTYRSTGSEQTFPVPAGVRSVTVTAVGAPGAMDGRGVFGPGGKGASVTATLAVTPADTLFVEVGGTPSRGQYCFGSCLGGYNGGGTTGSGGGGGGASDVRTVAADQPASLASRQLVAAGGGGGGRRGTCYSDAYYDSSTTGGVGGNAGAAGTTGTDGCSTTLDGGRGGTAGTPTAGGADGNGNPTGATAGRAGTGGNGIQNIGGAGGGGWFGGGGGGSVTFLDPPDGPLNGAGGGGGGSNLVPSNGSSALDTTGVPQVVISYTVPSDTTAPTTTATFSGTPGSNGWYTSGGLVTLTAVDDPDGSGVRGTSYSLDGGAPTTYSGPFPVSGDGVHTVTSSSVDDADNTEQTQTLSLPVDATAPTVTFTGNAGSYTVDQTVNITCAATDATSGVASDTCTHISEPASSFPLGTTTITATATDDAGNTSGPVSTSFTVTGPTSTPVSYPLTGTATVTGRAPVPFGPVPLTATLTTTGTAVAGTGITDGQLASTPTTFSGTFFGFLPATVTAHLENTVPVTATTSDGGTALTASVRLVVDQVSVLGLGLITPGATCATVTPSTVTLTGAPGVLRGGGPLSGTYTANRFSGCGFLAPFLEPQLDRIAGVPQSVTVTLGAPSSAGTTG